MRYNLLNRRSRPGLFVSLFLLLAFALPAAAEDMPPPRRMPRLPVSRQILAEKAEHSQMPHTLEGPAAIIDGERLRIEETDVRLFGIVPPQLSASFGPQARSELDKLANGQNLNCLIRDRDRDGRLLATCITAGGDDMALDLLKRGLAVTARGSLAGSELNMAYLGAEQTAQNARIGIWSTAGAAASAPALSPAPQPAHTEVAAPPAPPKEEKHTDKASVPEPATIATAAAAVSAATPVAPPQPVTSDTSRHDGLGWIERYQALIGGLLMFATALSIVIAVWFQKRRERLDENRSIAAALRGELMAARGVCVGRIKTITDEEQDYLATWPRIRSTLYQAYVGRLGLLGAELARQVASIYGQSSDYASLYSPNGAACDHPKKNALETLVRHIDQILPKLAGIEKTGSIPVRAYTNYSRQTYEAPPKALPAQPSYKSIAPPVSAAQPSVTQNWTTYQAPTPATGALKNADVTTLQQPRPAVKAQSVPPNVTRMATAKPQQAERPAAKPALWDAVRGFIQGQRNAIDDTPLHHDDPHMSEYAAMIEEDMARYPYVESFDPLDVAPAKRSR